MMASSSSAASSPTATATATATAAPLVRPESPSNNSLVFLEDEDPGMITTTMISENKIEMDFDAMMRMPMSMDDNTTCTRTKEDAALAVALNHHDHDHDRAYDYDDHEYDACIKSDTLLTSLPVAAASPSSSSSSQQHDGGHAEAGGVDECRKVSIHNANDDDDDNERPDLSQDSFSIASFQDSVEDQLLLLDDASDKSMDQLLDAIMNTDNHNHCNNESTKDDHEFFDDRDAVVPIEESCSLLSSFPGVGGVFPLPPTITKAQSSSSVPATTTTTTAATTASVLQQQQQQQQKLQVQTIVHTELSQLPKSMEEEKYKLLERLLHIEQHSPGTSSSPGLPATTVTGTSSSKPIVIGGSEGEREIPRTAAGVQYHRQQQQQQQQQVQFQQQAHAQAQVEVQLRYQQQQLEQQRQLLLHQQRAQIQQQQQQQQQQQVGVSLTCLPTVMLHNIQQQLQ